MTKIPESLDLLKKLTKETPAFLDQKIKDELLKVLNLSQLIKAPPIKHISVRSLDEFIEVCFDRDTGFFDQTGNYSMVSCKVLPLRGNTSCGQHTLIKEAIGDNKNKVHKLYRCPGLSTDLQQDVLVIQAKESNIRRAISECSITLYSYIPPEDYSGCEIRSEAQEAYIGSASIVDSNG